MQATNSYLPGSQKTVKWAPEMMMLFWEALQCNKRFRSFIIDSNRSHDFVILCIFYAIVYKSDPSQQGVVRMCIFITQTMSVEPNFGKSLNKKFEAQETLPQSIRIPGFRGSYADYLIMVCHFLFFRLTGSTDAKRQSERRKSEGGSYDFVSSPVLSATEDDPHTASGARSPLSRIPEEHSPFAIGGDDSDDEREEQKTPAQSSPSVQSSRRPSISSAVDESVPLQLRGMSEKARGKMPAGQPSFSRQNSMTSQSSMSAAFPTAPNGFTPTVAWSALQSTSSPEARTLINNLPSFAEEPMIQSIISEPPPTRVHSFEWSALSMGWYESLLWGFIFSSEMVVGSASGATPGTVGVWNGTGVKLFKVQEAAAQGPTLLAPKGAVDAVGSNLVQRIGNLSLRRASTQDSQNSSRAPSVREV
ncbi:unnamed protein product [Aspergillus oryzae var. brunneus]|uniref:Unnamed protein product n=1 Tax=Aspergillus oryzae var. brunneus TaxID=332754 RepID=A0ABQ6L0W4_ASPOZ|nr:unnamed protein product [Aspergillus oryzae var. brunneus]